MDIEELKKEIGSYDDQLQTVEDTIKQYQEQLNELEEKAGEAKVRGDLC